MRENACRTVETEQRLRSALSEGALKLALHPVHHLAEERAWGFRVVPAMTDDTNNLVRLRQAVPVTKENGLLALLTEFVLLQACVTITDWKDSKPLTRLSYPLGGDQFLVIDCASIVRSLSREFQIVPDALVLEVPESAFLEEPVLAEKRAVALVSAGVGLMLYGFSGGFVSFALLEKGLFSGVVIDRHPSVTDIFSSVVERVTQAGLMVFLESHESAARFERNPLVYTVNTPDFPLDGSTATLPNSPGGNP